MVESRAQTDDTPPGTLVAGRFRIVTELGRGGMARVHRAQDLETGREVALKLLKPEIAEQPEAMERFRREAEFLAGLKHPAIVGVEAFGKLPDGRLYLAMEILTGETLGTRVRRGKLSPEAISPILAGAAVGLDAAHRAGVVHRDLKPDNVFLVMQPGSDAVQVKLLDFGISKIDGRQSLTQTGQILGTPRYMAPEQLAGDRDIDGRADVYALGVIVYEALAGQPAFPATHPADLIVAIIHGRATPLRALRPDLDPELEAVIGRAMARAKDARYASATDLAQAWFEVVHGEPTIAGVRTGAGTRMMGAMEAKQAEPSDLRLDDVPFRPATFREFEARDPNPKARGQSTVQLSEFSPAEHSKSAPPVQPAPQVKAPVVQAQPMNTPVAQPPAAAAPQPAQGASPFERTPARAGAQMMPAMPLSAVQPGQSIAVQPQPAPPVEPAHAVAPAPAAPNPRTPVPSAKPQHATPLDEPSMPMTLPTRRIPWLPIIIVTAVLGLCSLFGFGLTALYRAQVGHSSSEPSQAQLEPQPIAPAPAPTPLIVVPERPMVVDASTTDASVEAGTLAAPTPPSTPSEPAQIAAARTAQDAGRPTTTTTRPTSPTEMTTMTEAHVATPPPWSGDENGAQASASELVQRAKDALRAGNARECVSLATEALAQGADATTYALRGDCYRQLGDSARALRSYQRFCQLAPSHPRVASVRTIAESLGGTCP